MDKQASTDEMQRELHATLSAMREVGPAYEDHLVESFVQKFGQHIIVELRNQQRPSHAATSGQRMGLAVVSVCMLVPLLAILLALDAGTLVIVLLLLTVLFINLAFNARG